MDQDIAQLHHYITKMQQKYRHCLFPKLV